MTVINLVQSYGSNSDPFNDGRFKLSQAMINVVSTEDAIARMTKKQKIAYDVHMRQSTIIYLEYIKKRDAKEELAAKMFKDASEHYSALARTAVYKWKRKIAWERNAPPKPITT